MTQKVKPADKLLDLIKKSLPFIILLTTLFTPLLTIHSALAQEMEYRLHPTDVIKITVHEQPDLTAKCRVTQDGYITFPLLGRVYADGLTVQELERKIKILLEEDYLVTAQVLIFIEEYHPRQVSVIGEINTPGKYDMPEEKDMTLLEAIAMAGGFTEDADINRTKIIRIIEGEREIINVKVKDIMGKKDSEGDIILEPDDMVIIPESFF